jgi:hypothetical protein
LLNLSFKGLSKSLLHAVKQAEPVSPKILIEIASILNFKNSEDITLWCLFLFAFFLLARKSNLVPTTNNDLKDPKFLLRKDVQVIQDGLLINMKWSKTIQAGERILQTPLVPIPGSILCPVTAFNNMISEIPADQDSPLFILKNRKPIFYSLYLNKFRVLMGKLGYDKSKFSTHSFRRGFATLAFQLNLPADLIQLMGDWHSDAYKKYIQYSLQDKIRTSYFISKKIISMQLEH